MSAFREDQQQRIELLRLGVAAKLAPTPDQDPYLRAIGIPADEAIVDAFARFGATAVTTRFGASLGTAFVNTDNSFDPHLLAGMAGMTPIDDGLDDPYTIYLPEVLIDEHGQIIGPVVPDPDPLAGLNSAGFAAAVRLFTGWKPRQNLRVLAHRSGIGPFIDDTAGHLKTYVSGIDADMYANANISPIDQQLHTTVHIWQAGTMRQDTNGVYSGQPATQPWRTARPPTGTSTADPNVRTVR